MLLHTGMGTRQRHVSMMMSSAKMRRCSRRMHMMLHVPCSSIGSECSCWNRKAFPRSCKLTKQIFLLAHKAHKRWLFVLQLFSTFNNMQSTQTAFKCNTDRGQTCLNQIVTGSPRNLGTQLGRPGELKGLLANPQKDTCA